MNPISILFGQIIRRGLTLLAGYLAYVGVTSAQQGTLVDALVPVAIAVVAFAVDQVWGYFSKKDALEKDPRSL